MATIVNLSNVQVEKAKKELAKRIKKANADFRAANDGYADIELDMDDVRVIKALASKGEGRYQQDSEIAENKELAVLRIDYVQRQRPTATLDLLTVKTEKDVADEDKFLMVPYVGAKRYKVDGTVWKSGYQSASDSEPLNRFVQASGETFQVLRAKGLFQLLTDAEVDRLVEGVTVTLDLYIELFL